MACTNLLYNENVIIKTCMAPFSTPVFDADYEEWPRFSNCRTYFAALSTRF